MATSCSYSLIERTNYIFFSSFYLSIFWCCQRIGVFAYSLLFHQNGALWVYMCVRAVLYSDDLFLCLTIPLPIFAIFFSLLETPDIAVYLPIFPAHHNPTHTPLYSYILITLIPYSFTHVTDVTRKNKNFIFIQFIQLQSILIFFYFRCNIISVHTSTFKREVLNRFFRFIYGGAGYGSQCLRTHRFKLSQVR